VVYLAEARAEAGSQLDEVMEKLGEVRKFNGVRTLSLTLWGLQLGVVWKKLGVVQKFNVVRTSNLTLDHD